MLQFQGQFDKENLSDKNVEFKSFKDQVIFEKNEVVKDNGKPYVVYTPYMRKWKSIFNENLTCINEKKLTSSTYNQPFEFKNYGFYENKVKSSLLN